MHRVVTFIRQGLIHLLLVVVLLALMGSGVWWVAKHILRGESALGGLLSSVPMPGQPQVVARWNLEKDQQLTPDDLETVHSFGRPDVFTDIAQLVNDFTTEAISKGQPILHSQVNRYQVVAKQNLSTNHKIIAEDLDLALTPYRRKAYTDTEEVVGLYTRQPITKGLTILSSEFAYYVVAKRDLGADQCITEADVELAFLDEGRDKGDFTDTAQVVGLITSQIINAGKPIRADHVTSLQVIAAVDLVAKTTLKEGHVATGWQSYREDTFADPADVEDLVLRENVQKGEPITRGLVSLWQVAAGTHLEAEHLIADTEDLSLIRWYYSDTVFREPSEVLGYYTRTPAKQYEPILKSQVAPCQANAALTMPAYHLIEAESDLAVEKQVCEPISKTTTSKWEGRYTRKAIEAGTVIQDADLVPGVPPHNNTVAVSFAVPASSAFGGNLKAGDVVNIFLVQDSEPVTPTIVLPITGCLLLSVEEVASGQAVEGQAAGEETPPPESKTLIVAAIPRADEQKFIMWLPSSHVILSVGTKR